MRESLTEKGGQQLLRAGKKTHLGDWGMCLQSFAGAMSSVCLADFGFNADKATATTTMRTARTT